MPGFSGSMDPQAMMKGMMDKMSNQAGAGNALRTAQSQSPEKLANLQKSLGTLGGNSDKPRMPAGDEEMGIYRPGVTRSVTGNEPTNAEQERIFRDIKGSVAPKNDMDFKPGNQSNLLQVDNPEYVARRAAALKKPGAVVGQTTMESAELTAMLRIAGLR